MLCDECSKRALCKTLCPEAELYVNQDEVKQREKTIGFPGYGSVQWPSSGGVELTKREREILTLLGRGLTREDVCKLLDIKSETLRVHIVNMKKKLNASDHM